MNSNDWKIAEQTVAAVFRAAAVQEPDGIFCKSVDGGLSYAQAAGAIHALADELRPSVQGRVVALILPNSKAFMISYFASLFAGGTPALINHGHPQGTIDTLLGDLNAEPESLSMAILEGGGLSDAYDVAEKRCRKNIGTYTGFPTGGLRGAPRIDHILVRGGSVLWFCAEEQIIEGFYISDHLPVYIALMP